MFKERLAKIHRHLKVVSFAYMQNDDGQNPCESETDTDDDQDTEYESSEDE